MPLINRINQAVRPVPIGDVTQHVRTTLTINDKTVPIIAGTILFYGLAIYHTLTVALGMISSDQIKVTKNT